VSKIVTPGAQVKLRPNAGIEWVEAGVDWISCSFAASYENYEHVVTRWQDYLIHSVMPDNKGTPFYMNGYRGFKVAGCFTGTNERGAFLQLTGAHANVGFKDVFEPGAHFSRLDLQFTIKYTEEHTNVAKNAYGAIVRHNRNVPITNRRIPQQIRKPDGSDSLYCGSSRSEHYGVIYNKQTESGAEPYQRAWRYETRCKNSIATGAAAQIPQDTEKRARWVFDRCTAWWRAYGVQPYRLRYRPHLELPKTTVMPSDVQSRLQWLERQVAPSIAWLTQQGYRASVLAALGLSNDALEQ
jgi:hypothetical protein